MRCKQGDRAVFVRCINPENIGRMVRIVSQYRCDPGEWYVEALASLKTNFGTVSPGEFAWADDCDLRPIRDPGHDEPDWASARRPRSADLREDQLTRARAQMVEGS